MDEAQRFNADQLAFWNGAGGRTWVARQAHTDATLAPVFEAFLRFAAPSSGERVLDVGCGCGAATLDIARAVGSEGRVVALDISRSMLAEGKTRADAANIRNVHWREADAATAALDEYDLLASAFGVMFFGNPVAAFSHLHRAASRDARLAFVCWRSLSENPWIGTSMRAVSPHVPPRPPGNPTAPGMFAFADPERVTAILAGAGWRAPRCEKLDLELDIAAGRGLEEAVLQATRIGAINSWLRDQSTDVITAASAAIHDALKPHAMGTSVRLPSATWLVSASAN